MTTCHNNRIKSKEIRAQATHGQIRACPKLGQLLHFFAGNDDAQITLEGFRYCYMAIDRSKIETRKLHEQYSCQVTTLGRKR
jgi:hypothetical protein